MNPGIHPFLYSHPPVPRSRRELFLIRFRDQFTPGNPPSNRSGFVPRIILKCPKIKDSNVSGKRNACITSQEPQYGAETRWLSRRVLFRRIETTESSQAGRYSFGKFLNKARKLLINSPLSAFHHLETINHQSHSLLTIHYSPLTPPHPPPLKPGTWNLELHPPPPPCRNFPVVLKYPSHDEPITGSTEKWATPTFLFLKEPDGVRKNYADHAQDSKERIRTRLQ
jgi:hypothetical protein